MYVNYFILFDPTNLVALATLEMLQHYVNVVPSNGYDIIELAVLLEMVLERSGKLCITPMAGGYINSVLVNNVLYTLDPNLISSFCSIYLN